MTTYRLLFKADAYKEWNKLGANLQQQFKKKLKERLANPHVPSARLHGLDNCYKIKLRAAGYRLVYQVDDKEIIVTVITVGRRDRNLVYKIAAGRLA